MQKKGTNKHKKSKTKAKHKHQKRSFISHSNTLIQALIKPLSSPYSDLIEIFSNCYPVGCFKTPKKEKQNPIQPKLDKKAQHISILKNDKNISGKKL